MVRTCWFCLFTGSLDPENYPIGLSKAGWCPSKVEVVSDRSKVSGLWLLIIECYNVSRNTEDSTLLRLVQDIDAYCLFQMV